MTKLIQFNYPIPAGVVHTDKYLQVVRRNRRFHKQRQNITWSVGHDDIEKVVMVIKVNDYNFTHSKVIHLKGID
jgi:Icc-related predicted phosphoesterase